MSHGITINVKDPLRDSISQPAVGPNSGSGGVDQKFTNLNSATGEPKPTIVVNVYQFFSHNKVADAKAQATVAELPLVKDESCWKKYFCCGR